MLLHDEVQQKTIIRGDFRPFDFHIHSNMSDGTYTPSYIVNEAKQNGIDLIAITDHDTTNGVKEAQTEGEKQGVTVISGVEIDTEFECELHIVGLGIDIENPDFINMLENAKIKRNERNALIIEKLERHGIPVSQHIEYKEGATVTRLNIAKAIIDCGKAEKFSEAFENYLYKGKVGYVFMERTSKEEAIETIHKAGGIAVLAHPCKLQCDVNALIHSLKNSGLDALEAYYPTATSGQVDEFLAYAKRYNLAVSCGSDYHGANRKRAFLGCAYQNVPCLNEFAKRVLENSRKTNA